MESFDRDLEKAAEKYIAEAFSADIPSEIREETQEKIKKLLQEGNMNKKQKHVMKRSMKSVLICAAVLGLSVLVCAAAPAVREYLNMVFLKEDSVERLSEVPEGYIGIYDADDLDNVRSDLHANYILMNDIVITEADYAEGGVFEGGFEPIGGDRTPYRGTFNGNGYVIDGLVIDISGETSDSRDYNDIGLFGKVQRASESGAVYEVIETVVTEADKGMDVNGDGDMDDIITASKSSIPTGEVEDGYMKGGIVKNLGLVNGSITVEKNVKKVYRIGAIAGCIDFIVGCYTENFDITFVNNTSDVDNSIGGIAGKAEYVDSCYTDAEIRIVMNLPEGEEFTSGNAANPYIGGVVGETYACVTSYFGGEIFADDIEYIDSTYEKLQDDNDIEYYTDTLNMQGIANIPEGAVPAIMTEAVMQKLIDSLDDWSGRKMQAFYCQGDYRELEIAASQYTTDNTDTVFYILDPECKPREIRELSRLMIEGFKGVNFEDFCRENNVKYGMYYCYDLRYTTECDFEGFDFNCIWTRKGHGNPTLRLFAGGSANIDDHNSFQNRLNLGKNK